MVFVCENNGYALNTDFHTTTSVAQIARAPSSRRTAEKTQRAPAWEKGTRVSGKQITMFLAEDRSVVEGGSHVRIEPDEGGAK